MLLEIDEAVVKSADWALAKAGDEEARQRLRQALDGVVLYMHVLPADSDEEAVTLRELQANRIIESVRLSPSPAAEMA